jgi:ATP-dependent Lon protease
VVRDIVRYYTREAGVRNLEREIAKVFRKVAKELLLDKKLKDVVNHAKNLEKYLGVQRFRYGTAEQANQVGQVTGLAWTEVGGELLTIEAVIVPGKGKLTITGKLGDVMQESIQAAMSVVRARATKLGIQTDFYQKHDFHVHVPEGATPKDGPSAGIAMCTAMVSALTKIPVRADVAMTGEITLRGEVLPIGGLKEKLLAAHRGGIKVVLIPEENRKDLAEIPKNILDDSSTSARSVDRSGAGGGAGAYSRAAGRSQAGGGGQASRGRRHRRRPDTLTGAAESSHHPRSRVMSLLSPVSTTRCFDKPRRAYLS